MSGELYMAMIFFDDITCNALNAQIVFFPDMLPPPLKTNTFYDLELKGLYTYFK